MEGLLNIPVTLVIKAPNQKIADQTVECDLEWTVRKLKEHLAHVYPSKPHEHHQRIIYSGRLLQDHVMLKEVLKQYEPNQTIHTVHLVCAPTTNSDSPTTTQQSQPSSLPEGLRHRHVPQPTQPVAGDVHIPPVNQPFFTTGMPTMGGIDYASYAGGYPMMSGFSQGTMPVGMPGYPMDANAAQMMWMQQMYSQYYTQFLQYYQQQQHPYVAATFTQQPVHTPHTPQAEPAANRDGEEPHLAANQGVRMNAQGGAMFDDDDDLDEGGNRDWLDWIYTIMRFGMLLCIMYFYSSFSRLIATLFFIILFYLYQKGWFRWNGQGGNQPHPNVNQPPRQPERANQGEGNVVEEGVGGQVNGGENNIAADGNDTNQVPLAPPQPGVLSYAWNFVVAFFGSLAPQQPPPVNAN